MPAATALAKVSVKGDAQTIALPKAQLTSDSARIRRAAVTAIERVAEKNDPESTKLLQASLCDKGLTVSQTAALFLVE